MNRIYIYGSILLLCAAFAGGFLLGRAGEHTPEPLSPTALAHLRERAAELRASVATPVARVEHAYAKAPAAAARGAALAEAAGVAADVVVGFDLAAEAADVDELDTAVPVAEGAEACAPREFTLSGNVQRLGETWAMDALLTHAHGDDVVWTAPMRGHVSVWDASAPVRTRHWLAGPTYDTRGEVGGFVGREWRNFAVLGGASRERAWVGVGVRW